MLIFRELYHFSFQGTPCSSPLPSLPPNTPDSFPRRPQGRQAQHQGRSNPLPCAIAEASEKKTEGNTLEDERLVHLQVTHEKISENDLI